MFGRIKWSRWTLLFVVVLILALSNGARPGRSQYGAPASSLPNLTGKWKLDTGETIDITQDLTGQVTAKFSPVARCWDLPHTFLFKGQLRRATSGGDVTIENGQFWACTRTEKMWKECGVQKLFETKFKATLSPFSITGENLRPGYYLPGGEYRRCRPDKSYEGWAPFSLTPLCRPSSPWFDRGTNCQDTRSPDVRADYLGASVWVCGSIVFQHRFPDGTSHTNYGAALQNEVIRQIGSNVCCDRFRQRVGSGQCDPRMDFDCDGKPNDTDTIGWSQDPSIPMPDINIFSTPPGASVAPFPQGLNPDDPGFVPDSSGCDCKWQLIKGVLNCGTGGQGHSYVATWKCPTTGREVTTTKNATANTPCP
jgi:hypothetical protein